MTDLLPPGETEDLIRARVRDLLEISRLDAGAEQPIRTRVPLGAVVAEAVETDPRRLERIVANLVVNAHRHGAAPV